MVGPRPKEAEKALTGRGKATFVKMGPTNANKAEEAIRNEWTYEAHRNLKQARDKEDNKNESPRSGRGVTMRCNAETVRG